VFWLSVPLKDDFINRWSFGDSGWFVSAERAKSESMQVVSSEDWPCLVCDDSSLNQSVFVQFFKKMGVNNPSVADEGASALQWLLQHAKTEKEGRRPFVLIDMSMPGKRRCSFVFGSSFYQSKSVERIGKCGNVA